VSMLKHRGRPKNRKAHVCSAEVSVIIHGTLKLTKLANTSTFRQIYYSAALLFWHASLQGSRTRASEHRGNQAIHACKLQVRITAGEVPAKPQIHNAVRNLSIQKYE